MSHHPEEQEPAFKVVDKRRFTEEGGERDGASEHREVPPAQEKTEQDLSEKDLPRMDFSLFIQSLAHQAMMGLGLVPWPDSGLIKVELPLAQQSIDILAIMKDKTKGNLSADEQHMLDSLLYQLQVAYVEVAKLPPTGSSIITK